MKKIIFCNVPMTIKPNKQVYKSDDMSIPASDTPVQYPIVSFLTNTLSPKDEVKAILLVKKDKHNEYKQHVSNCMEEFMSAADVTGAKITYTIIDTDFSENQTIHDSLLLSIIDEIDENAHIIADITYGPKDLPIILFTAMNFAETFLNCEIDNIIYGHATFHNGVIVETKLCDMIPLYYLNSITHTLQCDSPANAKKMLRSLLSL